MKCILNTGRTIKQGITMEVGKTSQEYHEATSLALLNGDDMEEIGLEENDVVKISSGQSSVVVRCQKGWIDPGQVFMPLGPWANHLVAWTTSGTGMPSYKGIDVDISATEEKPTSFEDLFVDRESMSAALADMPRLEAPPEVPEGDQADQLTLGNVVCPFCGCLCDDIELLLKDGKIADAIVGCELSRSRFMNWNKDRVKPAVRKNGKLVEVELEEALDRAAEILKNADYPLIYGMSTTDVDAQRKAVELGEVLGATVDNTTSVCHGPTTIAAQDTGVSKLTLGEVRNRADLVIYWGCNPSEAHVRHVTRYATTPQGMYTEKGREDRAVIHVDVRETKTAKANQRWHFTYQLADKLIKVKPGQDYELFSALRARLRGHEVGDVAGVSAREIDSLLNKMKSCKFGVIFFGLGLTMSSGRHMNIDCVLRLVRDLNEHTKFTILPMRGHYNVAGANHVMLWLTGYPYAVNLSRGYPVYNPGEFSAVDVLGRQECDAALVIASDPAAHFPAQSAEHLSRIPTVVMDPKVSMTALMAEVVLPTAIAGIESDGTAYRMDGVPIRMRKVVDSEFEPDSAILEKLIERVKN